MRILLKDRIYICHTYYHEYIAFLKELALPAAQRGHATLMLSMMSNDFESFPERAGETGLWEDVIAFDEKEPEYFPEIMEYKKDRGNIVLNMFQRIRFTRLLAAKEAPFIPVNLREYKDIYVFCDSDPIGYYLNKERIYYHAVEDGLDTLVHSDDARIDNRGAFGLKVFLSKKLNLIFIENGYGRYCIDMEVNDISAIEMPCPYYKEVPRKQLTDRLTDEDREILLDAFVRNKTEIENKLTNASRADEGREKILVLTDPLCDLETRERLFKDIIDFYTAKGQVFIKPHPRDRLDYHKAFPEYPIIDASVPMELLGFIKDVRFDVVVTVYTDLGAIDFADRKVRLGNTFMDGYEDPEIHNKHMAAGLSQETDDPLE